jgi:hypothetical protein
LATHTHITPEVRALLAPFFPGWRGDASEPALSPAPRPNRPTPAILSRALLDRLMESSGETAPLAAAVGAPYSQVLGALTELAEAGLIDALDPPPPCDHRHMVWYALPAARVMGA